MAMRAVLGWLIWASIIAASGYVLVRRACTVAPTPHGLEFHDIGVDYLGLGLLALLATGIVAVLSPIRRLLWWFLSVGLTLGVWSWVGSKLAEIEFVRTPPCWGMHSFDPGSGEGCPPGMRRDFTVDQLRDYYRERR